MDAVTDVSLVEKTPEEVLALEAKKKMRSALKAERRAEMAAKLKENQARRANGAEADGEQDDDDDDPWMEKTNSLIDSLEA